MNKTERKISSIKNIEELQRELAGLLRGYTTIFNKIYTDYDNTNYTDHLKIYEGEDYLVVNTEYENNKVSQMDVIVSDTKPRTPNTIFPTITFLVPGKKIYRFKKEDGNG